MNEIDEKFADVLAFLKAERLECRCVLYPGDTCDILIRSSTTLDRKRIARARWKRLRKRGVA